MVILYIYLLSFSEYIVCNGIFCVSAEEVFEDPLERK